MSRRWVRILALLAAVLALGAVGCGDDDDDGNGDGPGGVQAGMGSRAQEARQAAQAAAEEAGGRVELPKIKVGSLQILGSIESAQRAEGALQQAVEALGWSFTTCDAQGDPTRMARCGDTLLDRNVDVMFTLGVEPSIIKAQLRKAQNQDVPVINYGGQVTPDPGFSASMEPDETQGGQILADYLIEQLETVDEPKKGVVLHDFPAIWAKARSDALKETLQGTDIEIVATHTTDAANLVEDTSSSVSAQITRNPDVNAFWFDFDSAGQAATQAIASEYQGQEFPERPLVVTFHADLGTVDLMRQGLIDAVSDWPYDATAWAAVDQAAEFFARDQEFTQDPLPDYGVELIDYVIVAKDDLPPQGEYRESEFDFVTFFQTKWREEFGTG
jgi:ribose transport system substrate-binding protein